MFRASPSLRVKVFGSVGDVILLVFARLSAFLALWSSFLVFLRPSSLSPYHLREHPLVET